MQSARRLLPPRLVPPPSLGARAAADLSFIRGAMERAGRFTAVPGWGGVFMGTVALAATALSLSPATPAANRAWPLVWLLAAAVACPVNACLLVRKARRQGQEVLRGRGAGFLLGLCPPLVAGAVLTLALWRAGSVELLPETWLLLYGAALATGGATTVRVVRVLGAAFLVLGAVAALAPSSWGVPLLGVGFGGLHLAFGTWVGIRHGG